MRADEIGLARLENYSSQFKLDFGPNRREVIDRLDRLLRACRGYGVVPGGQPHALSIQRDRR
jgi:hypothetical protein